MSSIKEWNNLLIFKGIGETPTLTMEVKTLTPIEVTVEITDKDKFLSLFPKSIFNEKHFVTLLKKGILKDNSIFSIIETKHTDNVLSQFDYDITDVYRVYSNKYSKSSRFLWFNKLSFDD